MDFVVGLIVLGVVGTFGYFVVYPKYLEKKAKKAAKEAAREARKNAPKSDEPRPDHAGKPDKSEDAGV